MECSCECCRQACKTRPGWFSPGEVEKLASITGKTVKEIFDQYLAVDFYFDEGENTAVLAPATIAMETGTEYPFDPRGQCVFYKDDKCQIHAAKPNECSFYDHGKSEEVCFENRLKIVEDWKNNQNQIEELLQRKPEPPAPDIFSIISLLTPK